MSAQRFDGKQYIPDQASDSTDGADVGVHDLLLETIKALTAERDALVNAVAERDALREQVDELLNLARGADHLFRGEKYYSEFSGDDQVALWRKAYATLAQTAETEGR